MRSYRLYRSSRPYMLSRCVSLQLTSLSTLLSPNELIVFPFRESLPLDPGVGPVISVRSSISLSSLNPGIESALCSRLHSLFFFGTRKPYSPSVIIVVVAVVSNLLPALPGPFSLDQRERNLRKQWWLSLAYSVL